MAQLGKAISIVSSEEGLMISMQAQLDAISVKVDPFLAQKEKEKEAAQLAEITRLAEEQLRLQKQAQAQSSLENMKDTGLSLECLSQMLSTEKRKLAEPSMSADCAIPEPAQKSPE